VEVLAWISVATLAGGVLSVVLAAGFAFSARPGWIHTLVSFAIGAMLGAAFLELLPHAFRGGDATRVAATLLGGILAFFVLEKLVLWRHCHVEDCEAHDHHSEPNDHGRSGTLILIGDSFHNFVDGILIAAAFLESTDLGIVTAAAVIAHEIPQEMGDFVILLHSGFSKARALALNALSGVAMMVGGVVGYYALNVSLALINSMLAVAAASMIYVAVADLIPGLHKRPELQATFQQVVLIGLGIGAIWLVGLVTHGA
jgi:zinc and cadmium transporter